MKVQIRSSFAALVWCLLAGAASVGHAADLALSNSPLFVGGNVEPNVYFLVDDSGSMEMEWLASGVGDGDVDFRYVLPGKNNGRDWNGFGDFESRRVIPTVEALEAAIAAAGAPVNLTIWQMRSPEFNVMYYNPDIEYKPWAGTNADGTPKFVDADPAAALLDPVNEDLDGNGDPEPLAERIVDLTAATGPFANEPPRLYSYLTYDGVPDRYEENFYPATYYISFDVDGDGEYGPDDYKRIEIRAGAGPFTNAAAGGRADCIGETLADGSASDGNTCSYAKEIVNFANWFQYHRKRSYAARAAMAAVVENLSGIRLGIHLFQQDDPLNLPLSMTDPANKINALDMIHNLPFSCFVNSDISRCFGTPARQGLYDLGKLFETEISVFDPSGESYSEGVVRVEAVTPLLSAEEGGACQQNFAIMVTDGYWNALRFAEDEIDDNDSDGDSPYDDDATGGFKDDVSETLADVAMHFYETDLHEELDNIVPNTGGDGTVDLTGALPPVAIDNATHQRMITYTIAFGIDGYALDPFGMTPERGDTWPTEADFVWTDVRDLTLLSAEREKTRVDDLFHAAYNGRGLFLSANNPAKLTSELERVLDDIVDRTAKSGAAVALTSGSLSSDSLLFQVRFDPQTWSGQLLAVPIIDTGLPRDVGRPSTMLQFEAGCVMTGGECPTIAACAIDEEACSESATTATYPGQSWNSVGTNPRKILTWRPGDVDDDIDGKAIRFAWPADPAAPSENELSAAQIAYLKWNPATDAADLDDATGEARLQFLRGRQDLSAMRSRATLLGDIVSSTPAYVGAPPFAYPDGMELALDADAPSYSAFTAANAARTPVIYVGANDGMLHAFDATTGENGGTEKGAYIPSLVYRNLWRLTEKGYGTSIGHRFFVNGSPAVGDALLDGSWRTVLVGTLGQGGQGVFALDVTDPDGFDETDPGSTVLWEFTDDHDADLGYTYGRAHIVRLYNGKWAAIVSNGYNNTEDDTAFGGRQSSTGNGVLYVLDLETGEPIRRFDTGHGTADDPEGLGRPNGLAEPTPVDVDGDRITDFVYVPDLFGNVFKIDLTGTCKVAAPAAGCASTWQFLPVSGAKKTPLYTAKDGTGKQQPITSRIEVGLHPTQPGYLIFFGTGKYLETTDGANTDMQTFYGLWDRDNGAAIPSGNRDGLLSQEILSEISDTFDLPDGAGTNTEELRLSTTDLVNWGEKNGWYMDLVNTEGGTSTPDGERVVANPILRDGRIIFVTTNPSGNPCSGGGVSWLMELSANDGARLPLSPFDLNKDGVFDSSDLAGDSGEVTSGIKLKEITVSSPGILEDGNSGYGGASGTVGREYKYFSGSESGQLDYLMESSGRSKGRQSWRQIWSN